MSIRPVGLVLNWENKSTVSFTWEKKYRYHICLLGIKNISWILHTYSPWVCVIKVCSNGGASYIIGEIIAKDNLNIAKFMQTFENLLLQNY